MNFLKSICIRKMMIQDFEEILQISNEELGEGYLNPTFLEYFCTETEKYLTKVAFNQDGKIIAFLITSILRAIELQNEILNLDTKLNKELSEYPVIGFIKTIATKKEYKRNGIANALLRSSLEEFKRRDVPIIFTTAWINSISEKTNLHTILIRNDFKIIQQIPNYWKEESLIRHYLCPACGNPPCRCSVAIYKKQQ